MPSTSRKPHLIEDAEEENSDAPVAPVQMLLIDASSVSSSRARPVSPLPCPAATTTSSDSSRDDFTQVSANSSQDEEGCSNAIALNEQQSFLLFVKIFSLYMARIHTPQNAFKERFRSIISKCTAENRRQNPAYMPLQPVVEERLRHELGAELWGDALRILHGYCQRQGIQLCHRY